MCPRSALLRMRIIAVSLLGTWITVDVRPLDVLPHRKIQPPNLLSSCLLSSFDLRPVSRAAARFPPTCPTHGASLFVGRIPSRREHGTQEKRRQEVWQEGRPGSSHRDAAFQEEE